MCIISKDIDRFGGYAQTFNQNRRIVMGQILKTLSKCFITFETEQQYVDTYKKDLLDTYYQMFPETEVSDKMVEDILKLEYQRQELLKSEKWYKNCAYIVYGALVASWIIFAIISICEAI